MSPSFLVIFSPTCFGFPFITFCCPFQSHSVCLLACPVPRPPLQSNPPIELYTPVPIIQKTGKKKNEK